MLIGRTVNYYSMYMVSSFLLRKRFGVELLLQYMAVMKGSSSMHKKEKKPCNMFYLISDVYDITDERMLKAFYH